jgi:hypothetical protein
MNLLCKLLALAAITAVPVLSAQAGTSLAVGDLHGAALRDWRQANDANQFATATDLVERILNLHDPIALRPKARQVQACINRVAADFQQGSQAVADTAVACMAELGMLGKRGA